LQKGLPAGSNCQAPTGSNKVSFTYDVLGRHIVTNYADSTPDVTRSYDANSNVLTTNRGAGGSAVNWSYTYDNANNLKTETLSLDGRSFALSYTYNNLGQLTKRTQPTGRAIVYAVDGLGRHTNVSAWGHTYASGITYHPSGAVAGLNYGSGHVYSQTLNARQMPLRVLTQKGAIKAIDMTYAYNARGQVTSTVNNAIGGDNRTYNYDSLGRLISATGPWGNANYVYDALGNIRTKTEGTRALTMSYDSKNRLTSHTDSGGPNRSLSYDTRGNVTRLGVLNFVYDLSNQPVAISGSASGSYRHDGNFKRVKSVVNGETIYNVYDASGVLAYVENSGTGRKTDYIRGAGMTLARTDLGVSYTYLYSDHLGSAQTATPANGQISWREKYTPYGSSMNNPAANDNQAGFTGHIKDTATGLKPLPWPFSSIFDIQHQIFRPHRICSKVCRRGIMTRC
jgi:YD repeat-containing protein